MPRGDGLLTHDLLPGEKGPQDACGVFGVWAPGEEVSKLTYFGLYALQHRGQESAGMAVSDGSRIVVYKDMGLVSQVFNEGALDSLYGYVAIGHTRYSTTGASIWENAQPTFRTTATGHLALGHNGNLTNTAELRKRIIELHTDSGELPLNAGIQATTDTEILTALLAAHPDLSLEAAAIEELPLVKGAFSLVFMDDTTLYAARDPQGIRPLVLGRLENGWVVASESAALDIVGASVVREIEPGELIVIDGEGLRSHRFAEAAPKGCLFEYVYLARPDTSIAGRSVHAARVDIGRQLAREHPVEADLVIPVPESGRYAAIGYAQESGIPFAEGLVKNSYVGRTFIQPSQTIRQLGIRLKLNPLKEVIAGQRLVVVDDSIVRGNTQRALVAHVAGSWSKGSARPHFQSTGQVAVLLWHRFRITGRVNCQRFECAGNLLRLLGQTRWHLWSSMRWLSPLTYPKTICVGRALTACTPLSWLRNTKSTCRCLRALNAGWVRRIICILIRSPQMP